MRIPAAWRVHGVQTTGAGDMFTACYVANRAAGADPQRAAELASELVATRAREAATRQVGSARLSIEALAEGPQVLADSY